MRISSKMKSLNSLGILRKRGILRDSDQMFWKANAISELYKSRWQMELFFREKKQRLHIKSFIGTSENAVMIQI